jgi:hypothetical protein
MQVLHAKQHATASNRCQLAPQRRTAGLGHSRPWPKCRCMAAWPSTCPSTLSTSAAAAPPGAAVRPLRRRVPDRPQRQQPGLMLPHQQQLQLLQRVLLAVPAAGLRAAAHTQVHLGRQLLWSPGRPTGRPSGTIFTRADVVSLLACHVVCLVACLLVSGAHCCIASQLHHALPLRLQVKMWGECGGTLSSYRRNAADPGACCPINGVCNYVSTAHWQCQPKGWRAPAGLQTSYSPECSTDHLVGDLLRCCCCCGQ